MNEQQIKELRAHAGKLVSAALVGGFIRDKTMKENL